MASKNLNQLISSSRSFLESTDTISRYRLSEKYFTRNRKLSFNSLVLCMLKSLRKTLSVELNSFFKEIKASAKKVTSSAFVQGRKKLNPDLFYDLNKVIVSEFYTDNDDEVKLYNGHRILSIDGSSIHLPFSTDIKKSFGTFNNQNRTDDVILGRVSVLYDVLNNIVLDGRLSPMEVGEVTMSREHLNHSKEGDIIIMDRAYPSFETAFLMNEKGIEFIFRCKTNFSNQVNSFSESGKKESIIKIRPKQKRSFKNSPFNAESELTVRMIRVELSAEESEILMTSLIDEKKYPHKEFKSLYFKRWGVETFYNRFKNIIEVEKFSGTSTQFILQEFNCALYLSNIQTVLTNDAQREIENKYENRKYEYKVNSSLSLGIIRENLVRLFVNEKDNEKILEELKNYFIENVIPIRPNRKNPRVHDKYRSRVKPKQFRNRRDT